MVYGLWFTVYDQTTINYKPYTLRVRYVCAGLFIFHCRVIVPNVKNQNQIP